MVKRLDALVVFAPLAVLTVAPFAESVLAAAEYPKDTLKPEAAAMVAVAVTEAGWLNTRTDVADVTSNKYLFPVLLPLSIWQMFLFPLAVPAVVASAYTVPSAWLNQVEKLVPVIDAASAARVTCDATVGM